MDKLIAMIPYLVLAAFAVIGIVEYIKTLVDAIRNKQVKLGMILSPFVCVLVAIVSVPIVFGSEIIGTISFIYYTSALAFIILAFVQLFYDLIVKTIGELVSSIAQLVKRNIGPREPPAK